jgi:hypothetical protein
MVTAIDRSPAITRAWPCMVTTIDRVPAKW